MTQDPSLAEALRQAFEARLLELHVSCPATVTSYDATKQKITAQPLIMRAYIDESGDRQVEPVPVVQDVPVMFPGSGDDGMTFPIKAGDTIKLLFSEQSIAQWLHGGGSGAGGNGPVDPGIDHKHSLDDAVALPGLRSFTNPIKNVSTTAVVIRAAVEVLLGDHTASEHAIRGDAYRAAEDTMLDALVTCMNSVAAATTPSTASSALTFSHAVDAFKSAAASYLALKVKVY